MSEITPEVQAELDRISADVQKALYDFFKRKDEAMERVPQTEAGMAEVIAAVSEVLPPAPDYIITVEPQTPEDRQQRRSPKITIAFPKQFSITVEVKK